MRKALLAFIATFLAGLFGVYWGASINLEGYLGIILSIATMGAFIVSAIESRHIK